MKVLYIIHGNSIENSKKISSCEDLKWDVSELKGEQEDERIYDDNFILLISCLSYDESVNIKL